MDALPAAIGRYEVKAFIARGGMGTLYLASDPVLQRQVAIKLLREADNEELRARFTREARSAANLRHRNIVTIFDVGDHQGQPFMAMEYIQGQTLSVLIGSDPPPSTIRRLQFIEDLCDGLAYAHTRGVVHRDIKPANLMVDQEGTLKILDFGIARAAAESGMTQAGLLVGTLNYMSPEQVAGSTIDGRSDMFAVGAVMYELLTRRQAFPGKIDSGVLHKILNGEPEPFESHCPHLDPAIGQIVRRALRKEPGARFPDLQQMRAEVAQARRALESSALADIDQTMAAAPGQDTTRVATPTPSRRGTDREEIFRRRAQQIDDQITAARQAIADGQFDDAIAKCEQALLLDPNEARALDLAERARFQRDEAGAKQWLSQAQHLLKAGELTSASNCVREALALTPEAPDAVELARVIGEARLTQERERQRAAAQQAILDRAKGALDSGELEAAVASCDELLAQAPSHEGAQQIKAQAQRAIAAREREMRDREAQETAAEARQLFNDGQHADALALLEQFWPAHPTVSHLWTELSAEAARLAAERDAAESASAEQTRFSRPPDDATVFAPRHAGFEPTIASPSSVSTATPPPFPAPTPTPAPAPRPMADVDTSPKIVPPAAPARPAPRVAPASSAAKPAAEASPRSSRLPLAAAALVLLVVAGLGWFLMMRGVEEDAIGPVASNDTTTTVTRPPDPQPAPREDPIPPVPEPPAPPNPTPPAAVSPPPVPVPDPGRSGRSSQTQPGVKPPAPVTPPGRGSEAPSRGGGAPAPVTPTPTPNAPVEVPRATAPPPVPAPDPEITPRSNEVPQAATAPSVPAPQREARNDAPAPSPPAPAPTPQVNESEQIRAVLQRYAQAYQSLNVEAVAALHPSIDKARVANDFRALRSQTVSIACPTVNVAGNTATAMCVVTTRAQPRVGNTLNRTEPTVFQMQKNGGSWIVQQRGS
jgi:tetratricopeptide (TPR) repeat protein/predicted Ser/Thr protein kinase